GANRRSWLVCEPVSGVGSAGSVEICSSRGGSSAPIGVAPSVEGCVLEFSEGDASWGIIAYPGARRTCWDQEPGEICAPKQPNTASSGRQAPAAATRRSQPQTHPLPQSRRQFVLDQSPDLI